MIRKRSFYRYKHLPNTVLTENTGRTTRGTNGKCCKIYCDGGRETIPQLGRPTALASGSLEHGIPCYSVFRPEKAKFPAHEHDKCISSTLDLNDFSHFLCDRILFPIWISSRADNAWEFIYLFICLFIYLSVYLFGCLSLVLSYSVEMSFTLFL